MFPSASEFARSARLCQRKHFAPLRPTRSTGGGPTYACSRAGRAGADHGREVDHPPADAMPERAPARPGPGPRRPSRLPRPRRRTHNMDMPHMRPDGVRAAAQHPLHGARRACDGADLQRHLDPIGFSFSRREIQAWAGVADWPLGFDVPVPVFAAKKPISGPSHSQFSFFSIECADGSP